VDVLTIKEGDIHNVRLTIGNSPAELAGGTVKVHVSPSAGGTALTPFDASIAGNVVTWALDGTIPAGRYKLEVQITVGPSVITAPSDGYMSLVVLSDLA
jgi:hypothetical protein